MKFFISISWTVTAVHEREASRRTRVLPLSVEKGGHCGSGPKGHNGCRAHALPGLPLTHCCTNQRRATRTNLCTSPAAISQTLVTAPIEVTEVKAVCVLQTHSGAQMWICHFHSDPA